VVDIPSLFVKAAGYYIISSTIGRFVNILETPVEMRPNTWFVCSSIPGRMRRSTAITSVFKILEVFYKEYTKHVWGNQKDGKDIFKRSIIEQGSAEGILDTIIDGQKNGVDCFHILSSEFGRTIREITSSSSRGYAKNTDTILSKLYYGEGHVDNLSKRSDKESRYLEPGYYTTLFCAMQEPRIYLSDDLNRTINRQGLMRRIKWLYVKPSELTMEGWKAPLRDLDEPTLYDELYDFTVNQLLPHMIEYDRLYRVDGNRIASMMNPQVKEFINNAARKVDAEIIETDEDSEEMDKLLFQQTHWEYQAKLSLLNGISCNLPSDYTKRKKIIPVSMEDLNRANAFLNECDRNIVEIIGGLSISSEERNYALQQRKILRFISTHDNTTLRDIMQNVKKHGGMSMKAEECRKYLADLIGQGLVKEEKDVESEKYKYVPN